jgi:hypothetical protein
MSLALVAGCDDDDEGDGRVIQCEEDGISATTASSYQFMDCEFMCSECYDEHDLGVDCTHDGDHPYCPCPDAGNATFCWGPEEEEVVCDATNCN